MSTRHHVSPTNSLVSDQATFNMAAANHVTREGTGFINRCVYIYVFLALMETMRMLPYDSRAGAILNMVQHLIAHGLDGTTPLTKCSPVMCRSTVFETGSLKKRIFLTQSVKLGTHFRLSKCAHRDF